MKILVTTPDTGLLGGVSNHYKGLKPFWKESVTYHFNAGRRKIPGIILFPFELLFLFLRLSFNAYDVVLLNPSLTKSALIRDAVFLRVASFFNLKKVVFFAAGAKQLRRIFQNHQLDSYENTDMLMHFWFLLHHLKSRLKNGE
jgi:hypothetical protein